MIPCSVLLVFTLSVNKRLLQRFEAQRHFSKTSRIAFFCSFLPSHSLISSTFFLLRSFTQLSCTVSAEPNIPSTIFPLFFPSYPPQVAALSLLYVFEIENNLNLKSTLFSRYTLKISMLSILEISQLKENDPDINS